MIPILACLLLAYLAGSVNVALLAARWRGIALRETGSGNPGASNLARRAGWRLGLPVLLAEACKGYLVLTLLLPFTSHEDHLWIPVLLAASAFLGQRFPLFHRFRGGKGAALSLGLLGALQPELSLLALLAAFVLLLVRLPMALVTLGGGLVALVAAFVWAGPEVSYLSAFLFVALSSTHFPNWLRLLRGEENPSPGDW